MHGGRVYEYAEGTGRSVGDVLDFSANINPLGPPESVWSAIERAMDGIRYYPDSRHMNVLTSIEERHQIDRRGVFCGNGAAEVIDLTLRMVAPTRVFVFEPAFSEYRAAAYRVGAAVVETQFSREDLPQRLRLLSKTCMRGDVIVLNNPHNPTGSRWRREEIIGSIELLCDRAVVVVDESFMDFRSDESTYSVLQDTPRLRNLVVVRSATKMYAIPGLRFGFGAAHPDLVMKIEQHRDRWSVNHLAQAAAAAAYRDNEFLRDTWDWLDREQRYVLETWGSHEALKLFSPSVNYFLVHVHDDIPVMRILEKLEREGVFLRRCDSFRGLTKQDIRVAIRTRADNERLWTVFKDCISEVL